MFIIANKVIVKVTINEEVLLLCYIRFRFYNDQLNI